MTSARALDGLAAGRSRERSAYGAALAANLVLNAGWNVLFFRARRPWLAAAECAVLTASAAHLVRRTAAVDPRAAWHSPPTRRGAFRDSPHDRDRPGTSGPEHWRTRNSPDLGHPRMGWFPDHVRREENRSRERG